MGCLILSLSCFSNNDTDTSRTTICLPAPVARQIAIDLLRGDSALAELSLTKALINSLEQKIYEKDKIIIQETRSKHDAQSQFEASQNIVNIQANQIAGLQHQNRQLRIGNKLLTGGIVVVGSTALIALLK